MIDQYRRVLVLGDGSKLLSQLRMLLQKLDYVYLPEARSFDEFLQKCDLYRPDLVILCKRYEDQLQGYLEDQGEDTCPLCPTLYLAASKNEKSKRSLLKSALTVRPPLSEETLSLAIQLAEYQLGLRERFQSQKELTESTLNNLKDGVFNINASGHIQYINKKAELFAGKNSRECKGKSLFDILTIKERKSGKKINKIDWLILSTTSHLEKEIDPLILKTNGGMLYIQAQVSPLYHISGPIKGYIVMIRDVQTGFMAQENMRMMAGALENLADAVVITQPQQHEERPNEIHYANKAFEIITGWSIDDIKHKSLSILEGPNTDANALSDLYKDLISGKTTQTEHTYRRKNGEDFTAHQVASPVRSTDGTQTYFAFVIRDISNARRMEAKVRQVQKMEAIARLAGGFAHDFNNLLSIINSYSDMVRVCVARDEKIDRYLTNIGNASHRGAMLVEQLMTFSRRAKHNPVAISVNDVIQDRLGLIQRVVNRNVTLNLQLSKSVKAIRGSVGEMEQILINLAINASDAMPEGGKLTLKTSNCRITKNNSICSGVLKTGNYVRLTITDEGIGMDKEMLECLFDPFSSTKHVGQGSGLGLSCVYGIVKQYSGDITVKSVKGKGTTFMFYFPVLKQTNNRILSKKSPDPESRIADHLANENPKALQTYNSL